MNSLTWRVISALIAVTILAGSQILLGNFGLFLVCSVVVFIAIYEFKNVGFLRIKAPLTMQYTFLLVSAALYGLINFSHSVDAMSITASLVTFISLGLWLGNDKMPNVRLLTSISIGMMGLVYCVAFPALAMKTLVRHEQGLEWFVSLLVIVFSGDTGAYFGGRLLGKRKLMPQVSPKKTIEGSVVGGLCSGLLGLWFFSQFLPDVPSWIAFTGCLFIGFIAQCGDLFVSLLKRVADVKDSGKIMPGHGGILDRLDGVFIASPLIYAFAYLS